MGDRDNALGRAGADTTADASLAGASGVGDLQKQLDEALAQAQANYDMYLRAKAETDNTRRRSIDEVAKAHKFAVESFAESLVPVIDSLEKALEVAHPTPQAMREGIELTHRQLVNAFERGNLRQIDPAGEKFDPHFHQAIAMVPAPDGVPPNTVVSVLQRGWKIADRVLRPALVTVAQG